MDEFALEFFFSFLLVVLCVFQWAVGKSVCTVCPELDILKYNHGRSNSLLDTRCFDLKVCRNRCLWMRRRMNWLKSRIFTLIRRFCTLFSHWDSSFCVTLCRIFNSPQWNCRMWALWANEIPAWFSDRWRSSTFGWRSYTKKISWWWIVELIRKRGWKIAKTDAARFIFHSLWFWTTFTSSVVTGREFFFVMFWTQGCWLDIVRVGCLYQQKIQIMVQTHRFASIMADRFSYHKKKYFLFVMEERSALQAMHYIIFKDCCCLALNRSHVSKLRTICEVRSTYFPLKKWVTRCIFVFLSWYLLVHRFHVNVCPICSNSF